MWLGAAGGYWEPGAPGAGSADRMSDLSLTNSLATSSLVRCDKMRMIVQPVSSIWHRLPRVSQHAHEPCGEYDNGPVSHAHCPRHMGSATGWDGWDMSHPIFLLFNTTPMGVARKESIPEGLRPPQYSESGGAPATTPPRNQPIVHEMMHPEL